MNNWKYYDLEFQVQILNRGYYWLREQSDNYHWSLVLEKALSKTKEEEKRKHLLSMAKIAISKTDIDSKEWYRIWIACFNNYKRLDEELRNQVLSQGFSWLQKQENSNNWAYIFEKCLPKIKDSEQKNLLIELAKTKLFTTDIDSKEWFPIWTTCIDSWTYLDSEFREQILNKGYLWLTSHNLDFRWVIISKKYFSIIKKTGAKRPIFNFEKSTISKIVNIEEWLSIWNMCKENPDYFDEEFQINIEKQGISWIEENSKSPRALLLALSLLSDDQKCLSQETINYLNKWIETRLSENDIKSPKWYSVWSIYAQYGGELEVGLQRKITNQAFDWLKTQEDIESFLVVFEKCSLLVVDGVDYLDLFINWVKTKIKQ